VDCAAAHGARSLAVATGSHPPAELAAAGATLVVPDLTDAGRVLDWLGA
jgi:phosphoglycolate phosphatase-like HAD superfamily hydrolase